MASESESVRASTHATDSAKRERETEAQIQRGVGVDHSLGNQPHTHTRFDNRDDGEADT